MQTMFLLSPIMFRLFVALIFLPLLTCGCRSVGERSAAMKGNASAPRKPILAPYVVGVLAPGAAAALNQANISLDRVSYIINQDRGLSGGTHYASGKDRQGRPYGNALDVIPAATAAARRSEIRRLRLAGFAAWSRGDGEPGQSAGNGPHYHLVWAGAKTENPDQRQQVCSFVGGCLGLADGRSARKWRRDASIQSDEVAAVRRRYESLYGKNALKKSFPYEACHRSRR